VKAVNSPNGIDLGLKDLNSFERPTDDIVKEDILSENDLISGEFYKLREDQLPLFGDKFNDLSKTQTLSELDQERFLKVYTDKNGEQYILKKAA
jgi:hypothetical protein